MNVKCKIQNIDSDTCYISFGNKKRIVYNSADIGYTHRGEQVIIDFNKKKEIIGVELLGSKQARKPCQESGQTLGEINCDKYGKNRR